MEFGDGLKKVFLAGIGAAATTADAAKNIIDQLVEKGELTVEQGKVFNEELKHNAKEKLKEHVDIHVTNQFDDAFASVDKMSADDLQKLKERIAAAEEKAQAAEETTKEDVKEE
jgi:polyhydroxyalkanoate synthesis regulator phasin